MLEIDAGYSRIRLSFDKYEGWIDSINITTINENDYSKFCSDDYKISTALISEVKSNNKKILLPRGSFLPGITTNKLQVNDEIFSFEGNYCSLNNPLLTSEIESIINDYLECPYRWGGKSLFGLDCSGFVQSIFKLLGVRLYRDTSEQVTQGTEITSEILKGDLCFSKSNNGMNHVGIMLDSKRIAHCSAKVKIDLVEDGKIIDLERDFQTHSVTSYRRYLI